MTFAESLPVDVHVIVYVTESPGDAFFVLAVFSIGSAGVWPLNTPLHFGSTFGAAADRPMPIPHVAIKITRTTPTRASFLAPLVCSTPTLSIPGLLAFPIRFA